MQIEIERNNLYQHQNQLKINNQKEYLMSKSTSTKKDALWNLINNQKEYLMRLYTNDLKGKCLVDEVNIGIDIISMMKILPINQG
jgi:hypothetical protein